MRPAPPANGRIDPRDLGFVCRALATLPEPVSRGDRSSRTDPQGPFLSWPCPPDAPAPFSTGASTPGSASCRSSRPRLRVGFPGPTSCSALVVLHHLGGLLRTGAAGLLRPAPGLGVRRVSGPRTPARPPRGSVGLRGPFPRRGQHPSKGSPRQQPYRITAADALVSLPRARTPDGRSRGPRVRPRALRWAGVDGVEAPVRV